MRFLKRGESREKELTRETVREFLEESEELIKDWFREYLLQEMSVEGQLADAVVDIKKQLIDAVGDIEKQGDELRQRNARNVEEHLSEMLHRDKAFLRKGIDQIVVDAVAREVMATYSRDRVLWGDWTRAFSFESKRLLTAPLDPVSSYLDTDVWIDVPPDLLAHPLEECIARDPYPLPSTDDREGYSDLRHYEFWLHGLADRGRIMQTLREHGVQLEPGSGVLDFGCASGRVLRHFLCQDEGLEVWGTDINRGHLDWMNCHLPRGQRLFQGTVLPFLPIEDNALRLVYALSVFTHIDEFELAWLAELRRVLEPGGIAYLTIHSEDTWSEIEPDWAVYQDLMSSSESIKEYDVSLDLFRSPMPQEKVVFRWRTAAMNNTSVFQAKSYIRRNWGRFFDVLDIVRQGSGYQDVVVLRKPVR